MKVVRGEELIKTIVSQRYWSPLHVKLKRGTRTMEENPKRRSVAAKTCFRMWFRSRASLLRRVVSNRSTGPGFHANNTFRSILDKTFIFYLIIAVPI